jgi:hypothetical protein
VLFSYDAFASMIDKGKCAELQSDTRRIKRFKRSNKVAETHGTGHGGDHMPMTFSLFLAFGTCRRVAKTLNVQHSNAPQDIAPSTSSK